MNYTDNPDKPFSDYKTQMRKLSEKNIVVDNPDFAMEVLKSDSYYMIVNGYKSAFTSGQVYPQQISIEELYSIHAISSELCNILLKNILIAERSFKTKLSYVIAQDFGVCTDLNDNNCFDSRDYLCIHHYNKIGNLRNHTLRNIKRIAVQYPTDSLKHYIDTKNHIPPWILINAIPFGNTINWYAILKPAEKDQICAEYFNDCEFTLAEKKLFLKNGLQILHKYRNLFAHGNRAVGIYCEYQQDKDLILKAASGELTSRQFLSGYGNSDITAVIILLMRFTNNPYVARRLYLDLKSLFEQYIYREIKICQKSILDIFHLPDNIFDIMNAIWAERFSNYNEFSIALERM